MQDKLIDISVGRSRKETAWKTERILWSDLVRRLQNVTRTPESQVEYEIMPKKDRDEIKDVGGFVGGIIDGPRRKVDAVASRSLLTLDLDSISAGDDPWGTVQLVLGCAAVLYSTHSNTAKARRLRLVMPLRRAVSPDEYIAIARKIASDIGIDMCDDTTYEPHRLMYWPSVSRDADYIYKVSDGPWIDPDEQLQRYHDWRDPNEWPVSSRQSGIMQRLVKKQGDPTEKDNIIGAFCRVYSIEDAIEEFLPEVYIKCNDGRYTYAGGSTSGGLVVYENGKFAYSHHGTDPAGGKLCNSFDLVRLHLFGEKDDSADPGTPVSRLPSYQAMAEIAMEDQAVKQELTESRLAALTEDWDEGEDKAWLQELEVSDKGKIADTIDNTYIILRNDPNLKKSYFFDLFRERPTVSGSLPWLKYEKRTVDTWTDADDAGLRRYLEKIYGITNVPKIRDAVELAMLKTEFHPVRDYLEKLTWDGIERADRLFIDYLGAEDSEYTRQVTRKSLLGAVARIYRPGCKHDHMLVLVGPQGCRKSTTIAKLAKNWFSDSLYTVVGKDAYEQLQGYWLIEMGEMAATRKAELEQIKQFVSKQSDTYRAAYARRTQEHPRQCAFFGTTNDDEFMRDQTGGRRFWPVTVTDYGRRNGDRLTDEIVDQIWAEIVVRFKAGETWYLSDKVEQKAKEVQEEHTEMNAKFGLLLDFLDQPVPADWDSWDLDRRLLWLSDGFGEKEPGVTPRSKICALEIWQEMLKGDPKNFTLAAARELNGMLRKVPGWECKSKLKCGPYGPQRGFIRLI